MAVKRIRNKTTCIKELNLNSGALLRIPGRNKKSKGSNISRTVTEEELMSLDVQVNLKAGDIEIVES